MSDERATGLEAHHAVRRALSRFQHVDDDLRQEAWVGIIRGCRRWNPELGPLGPWLFIKARSAVIDAIRKRQRLEGTAYGMHRSPLWEEEEADAEPRRIEPQLRVEAATPPPRLDLRGLSTAELALLDDLINGEAGKESARRLKISPSRLAHRRRELVAKLRDRT